MTVPDFSPDASVWLTAFYGFSPEDDGFLGFTDVNDRDRLFEQMGDRQLVCIYGASNPETDPKQVSQLLGILDVERERIDSWGRMSDKSKQRNLSKGYENKWRFALPVRRAWRTNHRLNVKHVFPRSYDPDNGRYISRFGTWLVQDEARWLLTQVPFTETNVFGEPAVSGPASPQKMTTYFQPSRGISGAFGPRSFDIQDKPHKLYLAHFPSSAHLLAGRPIQKGWCVVKIGITGNLKNRLKALNLSFPPSAEIAWKILRTTDFPGRDDAAEAEQSFKERSTQDFGAISLGREYFLMKQERAEALFNSLSTAKGLTLGVRSKGSP